MNENLIINDVLPFVSDDSFRFSGAKAYRCKDAKYVFLRSKAGTSVILSNKLYEELLSNTLSNALKRLLKSRGFTSEFERFNIKSRRPLPRFFMIDFTTKCNMNCYYCLRHFPDAGETITQEQLENILKYLVDYCKSYQIKKIAIQPWGGEPLIAIDKILLMQDYLTNVGLAVDISIQTNGLLLTDELCKKLKDRHISIGLSIDGCKEIHNFHRKSWANQDTFDVLSKAIATIKKYYGQNFGTITVNSKYSLPYIEKSLDVFAKELGIRSIKMNLMHPNCDDFDLNSVIGNDELREFEQRVLTKLIDLNKAGYRIFDSNIRDKINNLVLGRCNELCHSDGCTGGYTFVTFSKDGDVYPCELVGNNDVKLGNIAEGLSLPELIEKNLETNIYFVKRENTECKTCDWYLHCRGGCTASCLSYNRPIGSVDEKECIINKYLYPELIKIILTDLDAVRYLSNIEIDFVE